MDWTTVAVIAICALVFIALVVVGAFIWAASKMDRDL